MGLYDLAKRHGFETPWLAWIPIAQLYILGRIVDNADVISFNVNPLEPVLPLGYALAWLLSGVAVFGWLLSIACYVLFLFVLIKFFKMYSPDNLLLYTILSGIGLFAFFIFLVRNNTPQEVPSQYRPLF